MSDIMLLLDTQLEITPGKFAVLHWAVINQGNETLYNLGVETFFEAEALRSFRPYVMPELAPTGQPGFASQQIVAPEIGGTFSTPVEVSCHREDGTRLEYVAIRPLLMIFPTARQGSTRLVVEMDEAAIIDAKNLAEQFNEVLIHGKGVGIVDVSQNAAPVAPSRIDVVRKFDIKDYHGVIMIPKPTYARAVAPSLRGLAESWKGARVSVHLRQTEIYRDVVMRKNERSIAQGAELLLDIRSPQSGFLTLIHYGSSGTAYQFVPNGRCALQNSRVDADELVHLPGSPWLPVETEEGLSVDGPAGEETFLALVTERPLMNTQGGLFSTLDESEQKALAARFAKMGGAIGWESVTVV